MTVPRVAAFSLWADITRWNTSCWGMEPSIMVMAAPKKKRISCQLGSGQNWNRSRLTARSMTLPAPPAMSLANQASTTRPTTRMIICRKSVTLFGGMWSVAVTDFHQADDQDDHLQEVRHRHRPHAAEQRVGQDGHHADGHAHGNADRAARQQVEHQPQGRDLGRDP